MTITDDCAGRPTSHDAPVLALLGPNGAGKTTAIGMLAGLTAPTSGRARLLGRDPRDLRARQRLGVMLQPRAYRTRCECASGCSGEGYLRN